MCPLERHRQTGTCRVRAEHRIESDRLTTVIVVDEEVPGETTRHQCDAQTHQHARGNPLALDAVAQLCGVSARHGIARIEAGRSRGLVRVAVIGVPCLHDHRGEEEEPSERRNAIMGGIPTVDEEERHQEFTEQVKLEPFNRALGEFQPEIWLTGIRREETEHRKTLDVVSMDNRGIIKVAPIFYWSEEQVEAYMAEHALPSCKHYFDPTKVHDGRECGLHTAA